jgi:hypothetical protein
MNVCQLCTDFACETFSGTRGRKEEEEEARERERRA